MSSHRFWGVSLAALGVASLSAGAGWAQAPTPAQTLPIVGSANDQKAEPATITITGSRVITDNVRSPTPVTSVNLSEIAKTTPSDVADALKLRVTTGTLTTLFSPEGASLTAVDLTVEVVEKSTLRVRLPLGAT